MKILLCGISCVGKTTTGEQVARLLWSNFKDLDYELAQQEDATLIEVQKRCKDFEAYSVKGAKLLDKVLKEETKKSLVLSLPAHGMTEPFLRVIRKHDVVTFFLKDDSKAVVDRMLFMDKDANLSNKEMNFIEKEHWKNWLNMMDRKFRRGFLQANYQVDIRNLPPEEAAAYIAKSVMQLKMKKRLGKIQKR